MTDEEADKLRRDLGDLRLALCDVPPGGASGDAPAWIIRLHRAACEVAGIGVWERDAVPLMRPAEPWTSFREQLRSLRDDTQRWLTESDDRPNLRAAAARVGRLVEAFDRIVARRGERDPAATDASAELAKWRNWAMRLLGCSEAYQNDDEELRNQINAMPEPPETPHPVAMVDRITVAAAPVLCGKCHKPPTADCSRCGPDARCLRCSTQLLFSARQRGDGLCGPCHAKATGTQTLADRCRGAGIEPSLVLEILRSPEGRAAIADCMRRLPVRMPDGTWREPTWAGAAQPGDWVRRIGSQQWMEVSSVEGAHVHTRDGLRMKSWRVGDVEVVMTAEQAEDARRRRSDAAAALGKDGAL